MKLAISALAAALALCGCAGQPAYQDTAWGMPQKKVEKLRSLSPAVPAQGGDQVRFERTVISGLKATVTYQFGAKNGLQAVSIVFDPVTVDKAKYLEYYHKIKLLLDEKYGGQEVDPGMAAEAMSESVRVASVPDYKKPAYWRTASVLVRMTCAGECDGSSAGNSIAVSYEPPRPRTEGL